MQHKYLLKTHDLSRWTNQELFKKFKFQLSFDDPCLSTAQQVTITGNKTELEELKTAVDCYVQNLLLPSLSSDPYSVKAPQILLHPYLKPDGLVNHQLLLGNLKSDTTENIVRLTTVQLFDLVTALEAYSSKIAALPALQQAKTNNVLPLWGGVAAVTVAAVGITAIGFQSPQKQIANEKKTEPASKIAQLDEVIPPQIPEAIKNKPTQPRLNQTISSGQRLPPPPAVNAPKLKPNIPDPAEYPLAQVERQSGLNNQSRVNIAQPKKIGATPFNNSDQAVTSQKTQTDNSHNDNSEIETLILESSQTKSNPQLKTEILIQEEKAETTEKQATSGLSNTFNNLPAESDIAINAKPVKLSQSAEIKTYFRDRWQPPEDLKQSLEYRLYLNGDGSIKKVIPLGKASRLYLSQTNIPVKGEPFISPITAENSTIRLLLNPDGGVKTFQE